MCVMCFFMIIKNMIKDRERVCVCVSCVVYDHKKNMIEDRERVCVCVMSFLNDHHKTNVIEYRER